MRLLILLFLSFTLAACGGSDSSPATDASSSSPAPDASSAEVDRTITIHPEGNQMRFDETEFEVAPGETIRLVFENTATSPSMLHNVVILTSMDDADVSRVGEGGMTAGAQQDYVPQDDPAVLANTPVAQPGETVEVIFTVPDETGEYRYICTFPGHWATMQGVMRVTDSPA